MKCVIDLIRIWIYKKIKVLKKAIIRVSKEKTQSLIVLENGNYI